MKFEYLLLVALMAVSSAAFADRKVASESVTYECEKGEIVVTLSNHNKALNINLPGGEWGGDYKVTAKSTAFKATKNVDSDLGAGFVYISQEMLDGASKASVTLNGGEDGGRYDDCKKD